MLAKICEGIPDAIAQLKAVGGHFLAEFKYDGQRAQIHLLADSTVGISLHFSCPTSSRCEKRTKRLLLCPLTCLPLLKTLFQQRPLKGQITGFERHGQWHIDSPIGRWHGGEF